MDPRSRPGKSSYGRQQTTLGRSSITTTTAGLVRQAATSGTRGDTGAITTAPCYNSVSCGLYVRGESTSLAARNKAEAPEVRPPGFTDRQPFPCTARLASNPRSTHNDPCSPGRPYLGRGYCLGRASELPAD